MRLKILNTQNTPSVSPQGQRNTQNTPSVFPRGKASLAGTVCGSLLKCGVKSSDGGLGNSGLAALYTHTHTHTHTHGYV